MESDQTTTLQRMTEAPSAPERHELADDAAALLGYSALGEHGQKERDEALLFEACVACGIRPFREDAVRKYMAEKARAADKAAAPERFVADWTDVLPRNAYQREMLEMKVRMAMGAATRHEWATVPLKGYNRPLPTGALAMAISLKKHLPEVDFDVHELVEQRQIDPFLSAKLGKARLYIAVWDEPGFDVKFE